MVHMRLQVGYSLFEGFFEVTVFQCFFFLSSILTVNIQFNSVFESPVVNRCFTSFYDGNYKFLFTRPKRTQK